MHQERLYRKQFQGENLIFFDVVVEQTDLTIGAYKNLYKEAMECINKSRNILEGYIKNKPEFLTSLTPIDSKIGDPEIIIKMCRASKKSGVGPMASVAGLFSKIVGDELLKYSEEIIVENGGDIFLVTKSPRKIGIFAGDSPFSNNIGIEIDRFNIPIGVCTSSGTVGHSLSFGKADAAVIISEDVILADAVATATGNLIKTEADLEKGLDFALEIEGIIGAVIIIGDKIAIRGDIKLTRI